MNALGIVEMNSIAAGMEVVDEMVKTADVKLIDALPVCPGKYLILVGGSVSAVNSSVEAADEASGEFLIGSTVIANVDPQVFSALNMTTPIDDLKAVGIVEMFSLMAVIYAADAAVKAADVTLLEIRLGRGLGGKAYVVMTGDVSAVQHSVEAAVIQDQCAGMLTKKTVIPSPHKDLLKVIC